MPAYSLKKDMKLFCQILPSDNMIMFTGVITSLFSPLPSGGLSFYRAAKFALKRG